MSLSVREQLKNFASDIMNDTCAYFLQIVYFENAEFTKDRSLLYSKYGQKILIQCLGNMPIEFLLELKSYTTSRLIDNEVFGLLVSSIGENCKWNSGAHESFYELCGKIIMLGIVAMEYGRISKNKICGEIVKIATNAYGIKIQHKDYDIARKTARSMIHSVFKILGIDITEFLTPVDTELGFEDFSFPKSVVDLIKELEPHANNVLSVPHLETMDKSKFDFLVKKTISNFVANKFEDDWKMAASNYRTAFFILIVKVSYISLHCVNHSYKEAIHRAIDSITDLILEKKFYPGSLSKLR